MKLVFCCVFVSYCFSPTSCLWGHIKGTGQVFNKDAQSYVESVVGSGVRDLGLSPHSMS